MSHVPYRPWCRFCVMGRGLERRHLTQSGDRDDDIQRVFADYGNVSGDSTPLLVARDRRTGMTFAAAVSMKGGGDPHAARLLAKWIDGFLTNKCFPQLISECIAKRPSSTQGEVVSPTHQPDQLHMTCCVRLEEALIAACQVRSLLSGIQHRC